MTGEEKNQVQNLINARMRLLNEKILLQEEQINSLNSELTDTKQELEASRKELEARNTEISGLRTQLTEMQEQSRKLTAMLQTRRPEPAPQTTAPKPQKPNYLASLLRQHFGYDSFKPGQEDIINALLSGRDVFCSMPGNYGKSICYRLPALLMPGLTLVITPSEPPEKSGDIHSESLTPALTPAKRRELLRKVKNGTCKILYAELSQLKEDDIKTALKGAEVSMTVLISPSNLKECREYIDTIAARRIPIGVFTTATSPAQRQEITKALRSPLRVVTGFRRDDVSFMVIRTENKQAALKDILDQRRNKNGIIFCSTPEEVYKLGEVLKGYNKIKILPRILYREITGKDIKFVIHYSLSDTPTSYAQEINCADSECIIIASRSEMRSADKSLLRIINDKKPNEALASYLGEDDNAAPKPEKQQDTKAKTEDFSDFDFGNANEAQKEAITSSSGPLLIIAGPGTGKTFTLVQRAVFLIQKRHIAPESIMMAAFTDKAAKELTARITEELALRNIQADINAMYIGTFHVICQRILNDYAEYTGFHKNFRILSDFDQTYLIMQNMDKFSDIPDIEKVFSQPSKWKRAGELRDYINSLSEELIDPEELMRDEDPKIKAIGQALKVHDEILAANNSMSYSAMLSGTYKLLRDNPAVLSDLQDKIKYIMIDEYQDTNYVQEQLIFLLGEGKNDKNICVVGDDDQSLYRFRGATVRNILEFPGKFGKNECKIVRLMLNYRSRPDIINFFSEWMSDTESGKFFKWGDFRHAKKLEAYRTAGNTPSVIRLAGVNDKDEWHEKILTFIRSLKVEDYNQIVFLFRSVRTKDVQELSQYLENNNINIYSPRSNMFFSRSEIHFALGCLISIFPAYVKSLYSGAFKFQGADPDYITYYKWCVKYLKRFIDRPQYSELKEWLLKKRKYHETLNGYTNYTYSDLLYELFEFQPFKGRLSVDINGSVKELRPARNLAGLVRVLRDYEYSYNVNNINSKYMANQFEMMMNIYLRFQYEEGLDEHESDDNIIPSGHVAFMTIHQAKGMEFPVVFVDSLWSSPRPNDDRGGELVKSIEHDYSRRPEFEPEDQIKFFDFWRLFYVAFSRARDLLVLTCRETSTSPSRYLESAYNKLDDAEETFKPSEIEISTPNNNGLKNIYSFTSHILLYETCPMQYKFFRELEFTPHISNATFLGTLVHATIEDIHRAVLNNDEKDITEQNISDWLNANYEYLSRTGQVYLNQAARDTALSQVMRYVRWNGADWSAVARAETELNLVRDNYILEGKIDLISIRDGEIEIIDFKSGSKPNININRDREHLETYRRQLNVYAYLVGHSLGLNVDRMKLYYTGEEDKDPEITYSYNKEEADTIMKGFDDTVSRIMAKDFNHMAKDSDVCRECGFKFYCGRA